MFEDGSVHVQETPTSGPSPHVGHGWNKGFTIIHKGMEFCIPNYLKGMIRDLNHCVIEDVVNPFPTGNLF